MTSPEAHRRLMSGARLRRLGWPEGRHLVVHRCPRPAPEAQPLSRPELQPAVGRIVQLRTVEGPVSGVIMELWDGSDEDIAAADWELPYIYVDHLPRWLGGRM